MVKCPKCGFFSYPERTQCSRCGAVLAPTTGASSVASKTSHNAPAGPGRQEEEDSVAPTSANKDSAQNQAFDEPQQGERPQTMFDNLDFGFVPDRPADSKATPAQVQEPTAWRQELSERVSSFRQRRARMRNEPLEEENLDFEFERSETNGLAEPDVESFLEFPQNDASIDAEIATPAAAETEGRYSDAAALEPGDDRFEIPDSPRTHDDFAFEPASDPDSRLEIVVGPPEGVVPADTSAPELEAFPVAPMGRRFLAGLVDGLVLLFGGGLFALIFKIAGGHLTLIPPNVAVLGVIACIFVWSYFALFTALAFSTPGQIWMRIEVRNLEGWPPEPRESFLRAFGYLVSLSAFMIGFFWALVDSDGLTWHDRISGTFLTPVKQQVPREIAESKL